MRTIFPVVFVPVDGAGWNPAYPEALDAALTVAIGWWRQRLALQPFATVPALAIGGLHPRACYTPHTQERIRSELSTFYPELAGPLAPANGDTQSDDGTVYCVYACLSSDPYDCPGDVIGTSSAYAGGPAVLIVQSSGSLDAFADGHNPRDPGTGSRAAQTGALAHELGHVLGLPHPADPAVQALSLMWSWWAFPEIGLSDAEREMALRVLSERRVARNV